MNEKHELEDKLPQIYKDARNEPFPMRCFQRNCPLVLVRLRCSENFAKATTCIFNSSEATLSRAAASPYGKEIRPISALEKSIKKHFFEDADDAIDRATDARQRLEAAVGALQNPDFYIDAHSDDRREVEGESFNDY